MKLSIVVPARNEQTIVGKCLDRLVSTLDGSTGISYEIVVVDDGSSDDTAAIVLDRASRSSEIRLVRRGSPPGFGRALRAGLEAARGDVIVIFMARISPTIPRTSWPTAGRSKKGTTAYSARGSSREAR